MTKLNLNVELNIKQGGQSITTSCNAEFDLPENITEEQVEQNLERGSELLANTAANTISETVKACSKQNLPPSQPPVKKISSVTENGVQLATEKQINYMSFLCNKNHLEPQEIARKYGNVDSLDKMEYKACDTFIKDINNS